MEIVNNSYFSSEDYMHLKVDLGSVYLFKNFIITEFDEGVDVNFNNFKEVINIIKTHFENRPFGFIANRYYNYAINLKDGSKFNDAFPNLKAYAIVIYTSFTERIIEVENHFCNFNRAGFKNMETAVKWVENILLIDS